MNNFLEVVCFCEQLMKYSLQDFGFFKNFKCYLLPIYVAISIFYAKKNRDFIQCISEDFLLHQILMYDGFAKLMMMDTIRHVYFTTTIRIIWNEQMLTKIHI